jgi:L-ascorbate metabolism protein UlaG (beta-lactamase superfamily)
MDLYLMTSTFYLNKCYNILHYTSIRIRRGEIEMEITWYGHSCFLITDSKGRKLLTDPFDNSVGYSNLNVVVDVITVSHHHFDHNFTEGLPGTPAIVDKCGFFNIRDIQINGIPSFHDKVNGAKRGQNIIYVFEMDGFRLCHLGDLGHLLSEEDINKIGEVDVLFIPVGGNFTVDGKESATIAKRINSHLVIPMHYKTEAISFPIDGVESFITNMKNGDRIGGPTMVLDKKEEKNNIVKIFEYISI